MFCHKCGKELPEGAAFCPACGESVTPAVKKAQNSGTAKKVIIIVSAVFVVFAVLISSIVILFKNVKKRVAEFETATEEVTEEVPEEEEYTEETENDLPKAGEGKQYDAVKMTRSSFLKDADKPLDPGSFELSAPEIAVADDMSNIDNIEMYSYHNEELLNKLKENGFVVTDGAGKEFFEEYEINRYSQTPNFVTVDSMMHTYHVYFAYLLRNTEKEYLYDELKALTEDMLDESIAQYEELKGSSWESAAIRNVEFFGVASKLLGNDTAVLQEAEDTVSFEYDKIMKADGIDTSALTGEDEDYSQYKPRGYYEGDNTLEQYFRAMMWYGRRQFTQKNEDLDRSALLITLALSGKNYEKWDSIYTVTSFFAGASDDIGCCEYMPVITKVYGEDITLSEIKSDDEKWDQFHSLSANMRAPRINSIPIMDTKEADNVIPGFRFMGQRFTIDAAIMQDLVYRRVGNFEDEEKRMLPDFLDVPAALGSDMAYSILDDMGETKYANYDRNMKNLRKEFMNDDCTIWNASLYAGWLNTLRPLLEKKGRGWPLFMQNSEWEKKTLETFAGSYTELKHDTVLYSKQVMAEMGGGWDEDLDFRGYVEPEPVVFDRFRILAETTKNGLDELGYISSADVKNLQRLAELADKLKTISLKELRDETLTDEEYELIEIYGGEIEHFWLEAMKAQTGEEHPMSDNYPAALVVDVATDPNGTVLEMANSDPALIYVVVPFDGHLRIAQGTVYSFYQFEKPISERMTDTEWRKEMGISVEDYENYVPYGKAYDHPAWTMSYRYVYNYD